MARSLGRVHVRQYAGDEKGRRDNLRTIIDFDEVETTMRFLILSKDGGTFRLGVETLVLEWPELMKLARTIVRTGKTLAETELSTAS